MQSRSKSKIHTTFTMTMMRWLEEEQQDDDRGDSSINGGIYIQMAWCNIWKTDPTVEISCATCMVPEEYRSDDDARNWMHKSKWFDTTCSFATDFETMNCTSYGADWHHETVETICSVPDLVAGKSAAEACQCQNLIRGYNDEDCLELYQCDQQESETNECNSCYVERECQQCYYEDPQSSVEYNGIPWTRTFFDYLQTTLQDGGDMLDNLEDTINVTQPSIQKQHMAWNIQGSKCTDIRYTGDGKVVKTRVRDKNEIIRNLFVALVIIVSCISLLYALRRRRRRRQQQNTYTISGTDPILSLSGKELASSSDYVLT